MLGHYLSEGVNPDAEMDGSDDCWFTYDDSDVRLTTRDCVCQLRDESAYILFYHREVRGQQYPALGPHDWIHKHFHYCSPTNYCKICQIISEYVFSLLAAVKQPHIKEKTHEH